MGKPKAASGNHSAASTSGGDEEKRSVSTLLLFSDDRALAECLAKELAPRDVGVQRYADFAELLARLEQDVCVGVMIETDSFDETARLAEQIRAIHGRHSVPPPVVVIAHAGKASAELKAIRAGADIFLARPFEPTELLNKINQLHGAVIAGHHRILIVDDGSRLSQIISPPLAERGYRVERREGSRELLEAMEELQPDVVIMSRDMPGVGGVKQVQRIRERRQFSDMPIILVSSDQTHDDRLDALKIGASELLIQPFRPRQLTSVVENQIRRRQTLRDSLLASRQYDPVTGLLNRDAFLERLHATLGNGDNPGAGGVLFIEIDNPRRIHQRLSIFGTDNLLLQIGESIIKHAGQEDVLARFGDYSFALVLLDRTTKEMLRVAENIRSALQESVFAVNKSSITVTVSIGVSVFEDRIRDAEQMVVLSETACGIAAEAGGDLVQLGKHVPQGTAGAPVIDDLSEPLQECLATGAFQLFYQPIVGLRSRRVSPINQVLLRMGTRQEDFRQAHDFIPTAERLGILPDLDRWVIEKLLQHLATTEANGPKTPQFMIVLSLASLRGADLPDWLGHKLAQYRVTGKQFNFALRFSDMEQELRLVEDQVFRLRRLGARITLTEFSDTPGAFNYLRSILVDYLRVPMALVDGDGEELTRLTRKARRLHKSVIVPGVEIPRHMDLVWKSEADFAQGYFIQRPQAAPVFDFPDLVLGQ